jgi:chitin disaccharide deacetylase
MSPSKHCAYLIVNADDYGLFHCVSKGILEAASHGIVTATGVFANTRHLPEHAAWLRDCATLDVGTHLNLTDGIPLTNDLRKRLSRWSGRFPRKFAAATAIVSGAIALSDVKTEWRAQIERCLECGLRIQFLNSHEHLHILPPLFSVVTALANEYHIPHVRFPTSRLEWNSNGSLLRGAVVNTFETVNRRRVNNPAPEFLGMECSGKLSVPYLERTVARLRMGHVYELMCHPGHFDAKEVNDRRLTRYHDWEGELGVLTSPAVRELVDRCGVRLIGFRDLEIRNDQLVVRQETACITP